MFNQSHRADLEAAMALAIACRDPEQINEIREELTKLEDDTINIFVYGTLRKGCYNHTRLVDMTKETFLGYETIKGYKMLWLGYFPALVKNNDTNYMVVGEVYKVSSKTKEILDRMEQGYDLVCVNEEKQIYAYIMDMPLECFPSMNELPVDSAGCYNYTPELEIKLTPKAYQEGVRRYQNAQQTHAA